MYDDKTLVTQVPSDASTDAQTDSSDQSTCSEHGIATPLNMDDFFSEPMTCGVCEWPEDASAQNLWCRPPEPWPVQVPFEFVEPTPRRPRLNAKAAAFNPTVLNAKAAAFKPADSGAEKESSVKLHKTHFAKVIQAAKANILGSKLVADVEVHEDAAGDCYVIVQPCEDADSELLTERLMTLAKEALLEAAELSRCIYVMGYCSPKPFMPQPQGFEATLGVMESQKQACWHVFKKGFCQHGDDCCKQHPASQFKVHVVIEGASLTASADFVQDFKQEVAEVAMSVMAALEECAYSGRVEAVRNTNFQGWTIEVMPTEDVKLQEELLLTTARKAFFSATSSSSSAYIIGYAGKAFVPRSHGFLTILGDMQDEPRACWKCYGHGSCSKNSVCRWSHPECHIPISVVVKQRACLDNEACCDALLDYLLVPANESKWPKLK
jgi:hypothetical protein